MTTFIQASRSQSYLHAGPAIFRISRISYRYLNSLYAISRETAMKWYVWFLSSMLLLQFTKPLPTVFNLPSYRLETLKEGQSEETGYKEVTTGFYRHFIQYNVILLIFTILIYELCCPFTITKVLRNTYKCHSHTWTFLFNFLKQSWLTVPPWQEIE